MPECRIPLCLGACASATGPVAIGEETIRNFAERETRTGTLRLLAPTACVMDRLAWYFHDADTQCLEQAVRVATLHPVDLKRIQRWARGERTHGEERFKEFERRLGERSNAWLPDAWAPTGARSGSTCAPQFCHMLARR